MKNINWGEIISFLVPISCAALFGTTVTSVMKTLKVFKSKDDKFSKGFFFQLIFESFASLLFGILFGALAHSFTTDLLTIMAFSGLGGAFGEKLYNRLSTKIDSMDEVSDLNPTSLLLDELNNDSDNEKKKD